MILVEMHHYISLLYIKIISSLQEYFMDLYLLAELKTISLKITTVDMKRPPADFRSNFEVSLCIVRAIVTTPQGWARGVTCWGVTGILTLSATWGNQSSDPAKFSNWQAKDPNILFLSREGVSRENELHESMYHHTSKHVIIDYLVFLSVIVAGRPAAHPDW